MKYSFILICSIISTTSMINAQDSLRNVSPKKAAYRSIIPGYGQLYNRKFIKAGIVIALEGWAYSSFKTNANYYNNYELNLPLSRTRYLQKRNKYAWWMGFIWFYGLVDSIVDAHLYPFKDVMKSKIETTEKMQGEKND
ncbi:MAG: hypothetical protein HOK52_09235 [Candidatus Marinimicrobia bacterium]|jgi:hypothetical protein|nr:hypothetical protein [Candidatus Neomarinimicrobiota bacterium]MBT3936046.1 hypothetical protein [Candidatus Neomarinimicrobiota bacterium]MBT3960459.1 hypothetical protein [Candidatus Neomarinimicrobiota bacterium]MBT4383743.1 hypothetical protein [Candidatus Neomarinimicrobiota bacterium]MBT4636231.1 hypothetical protein [Candidatus Neomarinimicrobiota bacterium]